KGLLKPNDDFSFESRRHADYPFALAFYINGIINNRLSVCCEYRCKNDMRIGGKRGLFAIRDEEVDFDIFSRDVLDCRVGVRLLVGFR
ncbi:unnamed protein product, partial [Rotaria sp. Silwood1]